MEYNCGVRLPLQTDMLQRSQSKVLCMTVDAPWYVPNTVIRMDLQTPTVEEIRHYSSPQCTDKRPSNVPHGATRQQANALLHVIVYIFTQSAECIGTNCK
jgi:hypothetical protein